MKRPPVAEARLHPAPASRGDADCMRALAAGDLGALGELYDRHHEAVRSFLRRALNDAAEAEDLTHEAFLTAARIAGSYDGRPGARPFLIGVAAQLARKRRSKVARWVDLLLSFGATRSADSGWTPEDAARASEDALVFRAALDRLSPERRLVFLMIVREEMSGDEVAAVLEVPVGTVRRRLHEARAELLAALHERDRPRRPGAARPPRGGAP